MENLPIWLKNYLSQIEYLDTLPIELIVNICDELGDKELLAFLDAYPRAKGQCGKRFPKELVYERNPELRKFYRDIWFIGTLVDYQRKDGNVTNSVMVVVIGTDPPYVRVTHSTEPQLEIEFFKPLLSSMEAFGTTGYITQLRGEANVLNLAKVLYEEGYKLVKK